MAIIRICDICKGSFLDKKEMHVELTFAMEKDIGLPCVLSSPNEQEYDLCMCCYLEKSRPVTMLGASATNNEQMKNAYHSAADWISIEPIREEISENWFIWGNENPEDYEEARRWEWVIIGAETGNRKDKIIPKREWIQKLLDVCKELHIPVFMKESLREIMGNDFIQQFPWEV